MEKVTKVLGCKSTLVVLRNQNISGLRTQTKSLGVPRPVLGLRWGFVDVGSRWDVDRLNYCSTSSVLTTSEKGVPRSLSNRVIQPIQNGLLSYTWSIRPLPRPILSGLSLPPIYLTDGKVQNHRFPLNSNTKSPCLLTTYRTKKGLPFWPVVRENQGSIEESPVTLILDSCLTDPPNPPVTAHIT